MVCDSFEKAEYRVILDVPSTVDKSRVLLSRVAEVLAKPA